MGKLINELESLKLSSAGFRAGSYNEGINAALHLIKSSLPTEEECEKLSKSLKDYGDLSDKVGTLGNLTGKTIDALIDHVKVNGLPTQQDKVVVRQYIADWYEKHKYETLEGKFRRAQVDKDERVRKWYDNCQGRHANKRANAQEVIAKMDLIGYTVDKEQLYEVRLPFEQWDENLAEVKTETAI